MFNPCALLQKSTSFCLLLIMFIPVMMACQSKVILSNRPDKPEVRDVIGVCHINGFYHFTDDEYLTEGVERIQELGSRVIKVIIRDNLEGYYPFNTQWPIITNLVQAAELPVFQDLFSRPFKTYVLMTFAPGRPILYFTQGMTEQDILHEQDSYYEFTKYLLTKYKGTGKTFILQNWEGDWTLTPSTQDGNNKPADPVAIQGMIDWLNARQDGVDRARREIGMNNVFVYHAAEVNLLDKAMRGIACATNDVIPYTHCDLYSYSAYDTLQVSAEKFRQALLYLRAKAPDSPTFGADNIYIGEFGWPESIVGEEKRLEMMKYTINTALDCGVRYMLFWELYCDGPKHSLDGPPTNDDMIGNWLIRPDGTRSTMWDYFYKMFRDEK